MQMQQLVRGWLVFRLTGSFAALGLMSLANAVPGIVFSPIGGAFADRFPKKTVIQFCQLYNVFNAAVLGVLAAGLFGLHLLFWHLFLSAFLQGGINSILQPSRQSIINDLVGPERLTNAIGINASGQTLMQLVGPGLGGLLLGVLSPAAVFWTIATLYMLAVTFTARIPRRPIYSYTRGPDTNPHPQGRAGLGMFGEIADGMKYVWRDPTIRMLIGVNFLIVIVASPYTQLLPGFVRTVLCAAPGCSSKQSAYEQGWLQSVQGLGAFAAALVIASSVSGGRGKMMIFWGFLLGASVLVFAISSSFWLTLPIMLLIGAGQSGRMATGQVLIQSYSADEYRGRVSAVWQMQFSLVQLGTFFVGTLAEFIGIQLAIGGLAFLLTIAMVAVALLLPRMRQLE
jgi:MFS family permease